MASSDVKPVRDQILLITNNNISVTMIDTAGTISNAAKVAKEKGALSVTVAATHGIFSSNALDKLSIPNYYVRHSTYPYTLSIRNMTIKLNSEN